MKLKEKETILLLIDVQEKLFPTLYEQSELEKNLIRMIRGAKELHYPIIYSEQYPQGLGRTIPSLVKELRGAHRYEKSSFSCIGDPSIRKAIEKTERKQIIICGIETHVCVYQTVLDLLDGGYEAFVVADAVMSRKKRNYEIGLNLIQKACATITSVEAALFQLLGSSRHRAFKKVAGIIK